MLELSLLMFDVILLSQLGPAVLCSYLRRNRCSYHAYEFDQRRSVGELGELVALAILWVFRLVTIFNLDGHLFPLGLFPSCRLFSLYTFS